MSVRIATTQNDLLLNSLMDYYDEKKVLNRLISIINGESKVSLRIIDWFVTNYAKKYFTVYIVNNRRFKVFNEYKLKLKAYSKKRFDPFCRWDRIAIPYDEKTNMETTLGQLNFFRWAFDNLIIEYIEEHYDDIEKDMNQNNSNSRKKQGTDTSSNTKTRKRREELSISACKCIKKEDVHIVVSFS